MVGLYGVLQIVPFEALCCAVVGTVLDVAFLNTVRIYVITLHMCVSLSVCVVCLPHYCILLMLSGPALLEKFLVVLRWGGRGSLFLGWSGVGGGWEVGLLLLGFSKVSKILFEVMLNSSFKWLLSENFL